MSSDEDDDYQPSRKRGRGRWEDYDSDDDVEKFDRRRRRGGAKDDAIYGVFAEDDDAGSDDGDGGRGSKSRGAKSSSARYAAPMAFVSAGGRAGAGAEAAADDGQDEDDEDGEDRGLDQDGDEENEWTSRQRFRRPNKQRAEEDARDYRFDDSNYAALGSGAARRRPGVTERDVDEAVMSRLGLGAAAAGARASAPADEDEDEEGPEQGDAGGVRPHTSASAHRAVADDRAIDLDGDDDDDGDGAGPGRDDADEEADRASARGLGLGFGHTGASAGGKPSRGGLGWSEDDDRPARAGLGASSSSAGLGAGSRAGLGRSSNSNAGAGSGAGQPSAGLSNSMFRQMFMRGKPAAPADSSEAGTDEKDRDQAGAAGAAAAGSSGSSGPGIRFGGVAGLGTNTGPTAGLGSSASAATADGGQEQDEQLRGLGTGSGMGGAAAFGSGAAAKPDPRLTDKAFGKFEAHTKGFGAKYLGKFGFAGRLGKNEQGIAAPIDVKVRPNQLGLGFGGFKEATKLKRNKDLAKEFAETKPGAVPRAAADEEDEGSNDEDGGPRSRAAAARPLSRPAGPAAPAALRKPKAAKVVYRTAAELLAAQDAAAAGGADSGRAGGTSSVAGGVVGLGPIIDMTGRTARVVACMSDALYTPSEVMGRAGAGAGPEDAGVVVTVGRELLHNVGLLADTAEVELTTTHRKLKAAETAVASLKRESEQLRANAAAAAARAQVVEGLRATVSLWSSRLKSTVAECLAAASASSSGGAKAGPAVSAAAALAARYGQHAADSAGAASSLAARYGPQAWQAGATAEARPRPLQRAVAVMDDDEYDSHSGGYGIGGAGRAGAAGPVHSRDDDHGHHRRGAGTGHSDVLSMVPAAQDPLSRLAHAVREAAVAFKGMQTAGTSTQQAGTGLAGPQGRGLGLDAGTGQDKPQQSVFAELRLHKAGPALVGAALPALVSLWQPVLEVHIGQVEAGQTGQDAQGSVTGIRLDNGTRTLLSVLWTWTDILQGMVDQHEDSALSGAADRHGASLTGNGQDDFDQPGLDDGDDMDDDEDDGVPLPPGARRRPVTRTRMRSGGARSQGHGTAVRIAGSTGTGGRAANDAREALADFHALVEKHMLGRLAEVIAGGAVAALATTGHARPTSSTGPQGKPWDIKQPWSLLALLSALAPESMGPPAVEVSHDDISAVERLCAMEGASLDGAGVGRTAAAAQRDTNTGHADVVTPAGYRVFLERTILPLLISAVESWDPFTDPVPVQDWTLPWAHASLLGQDVLAARVWPTLRAKIATALQAWHPSDDSAIGMLAPWKGPWTSSAEPAGFEGLLLRAVVPKLLAVLRELVAQPGGGFMQPADTPLLDGSAGAGSASAGSMPVTLGSALSWVVNGWCAAASTATSAAQSRHAASSEDELEGLLPVQHVSAMLEGEFLGHWLFALARLAGLGRLLPASATQAQATDDTGGQSSTSAILRAALTDVAAVDWVRVHSWYCGWRGVLPTALLHLPRVRLALSHALDLVDAGTKLYGLAPQAGFGASSAGAGASGAAISSGAGPAVDDARIGQVRLTAEPLVRLCQRILARYSRLSYAAVLARDSAAAAAGGGWARPGVDSNGPQGDRDGQRPGRPTPIERGVPLFHGLKLAGTESEYGGGIRATGATETRGLPSGLAGAKAAGASAGAGAGAGGGASLSFAEFVEARLAEAGLAFIPNTRRAPVDGCTVYKAGEVNCYLQHGVAYVELPGQGSGGAAGGGAAASGQAHGPRYEPVAVDELVKRARQASQRR